MSATPSPPSRAPVAGVRAAFIGVETLPEVYHKAIENFSARRFATFQTKQEAIDYLTKDESNRQSA